MIESRRKWSVSPSDFAERTHNPIRGIVDGLELEPNPNKQMIALSIGDPTVFGNLKPPEELIQAVLKSAESGKYNGYTNSAGYLETRQAIAEYSSTEEVKVDASDVIVCSGCSCALDLCITVIANPGQNILIPRPGFSIYKTLAEGLGIKTKQYNLKPEAGWEVDLRDLENQIDENTKAILINNPANPCGSVFSKPHLQDILKIAAKYCVPIIADEIYEHMVFPGEEFHSLGSLSKDVPVLSCSGLTKRFLIPGWRVGWIIIHDRNNIFGKELKQALLRLTQRIIGSNTLAQGAIPDILTKTPKSFYDRTLRIIQKNANVAYTRLSKIPGLTPIMPKGAMYMMIKIDMPRFPEFDNELELVERMVFEESVFCLPGKCFDYPNYLRIVITAPEEMIKEACSRMSDFCNRHYNPHSENKIEDILATLSEKVHKMEVPLLDIPGQNA